MLWLPKKKIHEYMLQCVVIIGSSFIVFAIVTGFPKISSIPRIIKLKLQFTSLEICHTLS